ncbi:16888_t:CDS:2 [Acaulospora colombiana]|uniref:16888_t:CDS:1 n=1 Tax=Acaulospora colombiana TaxID=27376 RepID=A0ACA9NTH7_9GLOM|nr:16888_t:CDS:2 [Acaulospora colombiana]
MSNPSHYQRPQSQENDPQYDEMMLQYYGQSASNTPDGMKSRGGPLPHLPGIGVLDSSDQLHAY